MNPFISNSPVLGHDFFNRETVIKKIIKETLTDKAQGDVWLIGERQVGKTSVLKRLHQAKDLLPAEIVVYNTNQKYKPLFAFANVQSCDNVSDFYFSLFVSLNNELDLKLKHQKDQKQNFINALKIMTEKNIYTVFLVDEFDAFLEAIALEDKNNIRRFINEFEPLLKGYSVFKNRAFSCVFASNQDFADLNFKHELNLTGSGLVAKRIELEWFPETTVKNLVKHFTSNKKTKFTDSEIKTICKYTEGYPYFTMNILKILYDYKTENKLEKVDNLIIDTLAKNEYEQTIQFWIGQNMPKRTNAKLIELLKSAGEKLFEAALKILIEYSKVNFIK